MDRRITIANTVPNIPEADPNIVLAMRRFGIAAVEESAIFPRWHRPRMHTVTDIAPAPIKQMTVEYLDLYPLNSLPILDI